MSASEEKLRKAFVTSLGLPEPVELNTLAYGVEQRWDSIAHMQLVAAIESAFDVMLDVDDVIALSSYPKAKEILGKYRVTF